MQCNYNSFIQIINFHGLFRNPLRCRKTGACWILVPLRYMPMVMRGLTLTVPSLVNPIDLLHIYMPMVMRGIPLTVPSLVNPIDLLHIYSGGSRGGRGQQARAPPKICIRMLKNGAQIALESIKTLLKGTSDFALVMCVRACNLLHAP